MASITIARLSIDCIMDRPVRTFPEKTMRLIVPFAPRSPVSGGADRMLIEAGLAPAFYQLVVA